MVSRATTVDRAMPSPGRVVSCWAAAAGVTISAKVRSVPISCTEMATASPSSTRKTRARARAGTPRAAAASASIEEKSSGRPMATMAARVIAAVRATIRTC